MIKDIVSSIDFQFSRSDGPAVINFDDWQTIKNELAQQTTNTVSPKFLDQILCAYSGKVISNRTRYKIVDAFVEKLRASA